MTEQSGRPTDLEVRGGKLRIYYGWWVVLAMASVMFVAFGCGIYAYVVLSAPLQQEFEWGRAETGLSVSLFWVAAVLAPLFGSRIDHLNPRLLIVGGVVVECGSMMLMAVASETWQLFVLRALMGAGKVLILVSVPVVLSRWFVARNGLALGIAFCGGSVGGLVLAPSTQLLVDAYGWRSAAVSLSLFAAAVSIPLVLTFLRFRAPADIGLQSDGRHESSPDVENATDPEVGLSIKQAVKSASFWLIVGVSVVFCLGWSGIMAQVGAYIVGQGLSDNAAANAVGAIGFVSVLGVLGLGAAVDRWSPRVAAVIGLACFAAGTALLLLVAPEYVWVLAVSIFLIGIPSGGLDIVWAAFLRQTFGSRSYGAIFGTWYFIAAIALGAGPVVVGYAFDVTQSFELSWIVVCIATALAALAVATVRTRQVLQGNEPVAP